VCKVAIRTGLLQPAFGVFQDLESDWPSVAMLQVMGEFLSDRYVGCNAAIEEIVGELGYNGCDCRFDEVQVAQYRGTQLQMKSRSPGKSFVGYKQYDQQRYEPK